MFNFGFLKTEAFHNAFSVLLGIAIISLFKSACKGEECKILKAPPFEEVKGATYQLSADECYQFNAQPIACPVKGVIEPFERF